MMAFVVAVHTTGGRRRMLAGLFGSKQLRLGSDETIHTGCGRRGQEGGVLDEARWVAGRPTGRRRHGDHGREVAVRRSKMERTVKREGRLTRHRWIPRNRKHLEHGMAAGKDARCVSTLMR
jgi:hypothetical protein